MCIGGNAPRNGPDKEDLTIPENGGFPTELPPGSAGGLADGKWWVACQDGFNPRVSSENFEGATDITATVRAVGGTIAGQGNAGQIYGGCEAPASPPN